MIYHSTVAIGFFFLTGLICWMGCESTSVDGIESPMKLPEIVDFNFHIKPILSDRCFKCHGPDQNARKANLRLDKEAGALKKELDHGGHAFVPGKSAKSVAYQRMISSDPEFMMPPPDSKLSLTNFEIALIERWIEQGARYQKHWAFIPVKKPSVPKVKLQSWPQNDVDHFVLAKLESLGMGPNNPTDKETLLRRLHLDLTGLPPTLQQIDSFLNDHTRDAVEKVVNKLLASPHYGEQMALGWMDVARYADSHGYSQDGSRIMYPWRDWVIQAFNQNMPFDQFITLQLAGDLLPDATQEQKLATAFLRNHRINAEGGIIPEEYRVEYVADRAHTTSTAFLGITMECARCHDHKYDPVSQEEYYQFFGFFNQTNEEGQGTPDGNTGPEVYLANEFVQEKVTIIDRKIKDLETQVQQRRSDLENNQDASVKDADIQAALRDKIITHLDFESNFQEKRTNGHMQNRLKDDWLDRSYAVRGEGALNSGYRGKALKAGAYDGMTIESDLVNFRRSDPFSVSFWLQAHPQTGFMEIIHRMDTKYSRQNGYDIVLKNGRLSFRLAHSLPSNLIEVQLEESLSPDQWAHIGISYDGSGSANGVRFFLNGSEARSIILFDQLERFVTNNRELTVGGTIHLEENIDDGYFLIDELRIYGRVLSSLEMAMICDPETTDLSGELISDHHMQIDDQLRGLCDSLRYFRQLRNSEEDQFTGVMVMQDLPIPRPTYVLNRGQYDAPGQEVTAGAPDALMHFSEELSTNRLGLAQWLVDPKNPLPARVIVNRTWQQFFGRGIVSTVEDFGSQGDLPTHPGLLDWLASTFVESGWDVKSLIKLLVMSATYQQSSIVPFDLRQEDPLNRLLARGPSFRLSAETLRDNVLAASDILTRKIGGPSVKPYQPSGLWEEKTSFTKDLARYHQDHGPDLYRRSLYTFWRRTSNHPVMSIFDAPTRDNCTVRRQISNTPLQALTLMNETQFVEGARILASRVMKEKKEIEDQIELAFRLLSATTPAKNTLKRLAILWSQEKDNFDKDQEAAMDFLSIGEYRLDKSLDPIDLAAMTVVCNTIMNFDEVVTRR